MPTSDQVASLTPGQLLGTVCHAAGVACPLLTVDRATGLRQRVAQDPTVPLRLVTIADRVPHYSHLTPATLDRLRTTALDRKRDLDVLQALGLGNGDTRPARYLYTLLFERVPTVQGLCAHDTPGWAGCPFAASGGYERVRQQGWSSLVYLRPQADKDAARVASARRLATGGKLHVRPHHLLCLACWLAGEDRREELRPEDTLAELYQRLRDDPAVPVVLVEGPCEACWCCDGLHPETLRCVHDCGLLRDYHKDLTVLCRLGLLPGDELPAGELWERVLRLVESTTAICGFGDGVETSREWRVCQGPGGSPGYQRTRAAVLGPEQPPSTASETGC